MTATARVYQANTAIDRRSIMVVCPPEENECSSVPHDAILAIQETYMQQIVTGKKDYEFHKYHIQPEIERIWFYRTAPYSCIDYVCKILPARTRTAHDEPLEEDGLGNREYNQRHKDYEGYDYAYKILSLYKLDRPRTLADLQQIHDMNSAPRDLVYTPESVLEKVNWKLAQKPL